MSAQQISHGEWTKVQNLLITIVQLKRGILIRLFKTSCLPPLKGTRFFIIETWDDDDWEGARVSAVELAEDTLGRRLPANLTWRQYAEPGVLSGEQKAAS